MFAHTLCQTIVVLSGVGKTPSTIDPAVDAVLLELGQGSRSGPILAQEIEQRLSRPVGDPIAPADVAVLREATDAVFRIFAAGDWGPAAETLERLRLRAFASPISIAQDLSLRQALYDIQIMLAECYRRLGRISDATTTMADLLRSAPRREPSPIHFSPDVIDFFRQVRRDLDTQPRGSLEVLTDPPDLSVHVDGEYVGKSPCKVADFYPGRHTVIVSPAAGVGRVHDVIVQADERLLVDQGFDQALRTHQVASFVFPNEETRSQNEAPYAAKLGRFLGARHVVVLTSGSYRDRRAVIGSWVTVDTARAARTGIVAMEPTPPNPQTYAGLARFLVRGEPAPNVLTGSEALPEPAIVSPNQPAERLFGFWKWVALGSAVVAVAAGGVFLAVDNTCSEQTPSETCLSRRDFTVPAIASFGVGGATLVTTGVFWWLDSRD